MSGILLVKMVKSPVGKPEKQRKVLRSLGLTKMNQTREHADSPSIRGMIDAVSHLVKAEEK